MANENSAFSGDAVHPFGNSSFTVPVAAPFTLLFTFADTISVFSVNGTTPAEGDIATAVCDDPKHCVAANAANRMYGALAVDFHRTVAYIVWPSGKGPYKALKKDYAVRYVMPAETMRQVAVFDRAEQVFPCQLDFHVVTDGRTLQYRRDAVRKSKAKNAARKIQSKNVTGPRGGHRYITGFIATRVE